MYILLWRAQQSADTYKLCVFLIVKVYVFWSFWYRIDALRKSTNLLLQFVASEVKYSNLQVKVLSSVLNKVFISTLSPFSRFESFWNERFVYLKWITRFIGTVSFYCTLFVMKFNFLVTIFTDDCTIVHAASTLKFCYRFHKLSSWSVICFIQSVTMTCGSKFVTFNHFLVAVSTQPHQFLYVVFHNTQRVFINNLI